MIVCEFKDMAYFEEWLNKWTTLEKAVEVAESFDNFLALKQGMLDEILKQDVKEVDLKQIFKLDKGRELQVYNDFHDLMIKAVNETLEPTDLKKLDDYRYQPSRLFSHDFLNQASVDLPEYGISETYPVFINYPGVGFADWDSLSTEINRRLFQHLSHVMAKIEEVRACTSSDCNRLFLPTYRGKEQMFCSPKCATRERVRNFRARKKIVTASLENDVSL